MMNDELKEFVKNSVSKSTFGYEKILRSRKSEIISQSGLDQTRPFKEHVYFVINGKDDSSCEVCSMKTRFCSMKRGYARTCSQKCAGILGGASQAQNDQQVRMKKMKASNLEKYGVEYNFQREDVKTKMQERIIEKYGSHYTMTDDYKNKIKATHNEKYQRDWWFQTDESRKISSKLMRQKHKTNFFSDYFNKTEGVDSYYKTEAFHRNRLNDPSLYDRIHKIIDGAKTISEICENENINRYKLISLCLHLNINMSKFSNMNLFEDSVFNFLSTFDKKIIKFDRKVLDGKELDFYIPDSNLGIECNGLYWHSERHRDKNSHVWKFNECLKQNIMLLQITDASWTNQREIWKSVISSKLGRTKRIYARKCCVKTVSAKDTTQFLSQNHLQGSCQSSTRLGLYHEDVLVAVMTFGKPRFSNENHELLRFSSCLNTTVVGGFSKLLLHFKRHNPGSIVSYSNSFWSFGNVYEQNGFEFICQTAPNYVWHKGNNMLSRYQTQKHKLIAKYGNIVTSENDFMTSRGWSRCYDAGNKKYLLK